MKITQRIYIRFIILSLFTSIPVATHCLPDEGHVQEYYDEVKLMKDFTNLSIKPQETISFWINQLIGIFEKKHTAKELTKKLKAVKAHPEKVFKVLAAHNGSATSAVRQCIYNFGVDKAQKVLEHRLVCGPDKPLKTPPLQPETIYNCSSTSCELPTTTPQDGAHIDIPSDDERLPRETPANNVTTQKRSYFTAQTCCTASLLALTALYISYLT